MRSTGQDEAFVHALPSVVDLAAAEQLHHSLQESCAHDIALVINGAAVQRVSTACVQVLVAAARASRARNVGFSLDLPSPSLLTAISDLGLASYLGCGVDS